VAYKRNDHDVFRAHVADLPEYEEGTADGLIAFDQDPI
jgi:hypothetical protein